MLVVRTLLKDLASKIGLQHLLKISDGAPLTFSGSLFHRVGATMGKVQALVAARQASLSRGTASRWQPEDCNWYSRTYGRK